MTPSPSHHALSDQLGVCVQAFAEARREYEARRQAAAESSDLNAQDLLAFIKSASDFECELIDYAYEARGLTDSLFDFVPPSCGNVVKNEEIGFGCGVAASFGQFFQRLKGSSGLPVNQGELFKELILKLLGKAGLPYDPAKKPSPHTSPLARHRENRPAIDVAVSSLFRTIAEARCEIYSERIPTPTAMAISLSVLASLSCTGWKDREPFVEVYRLDHSAEKLASLGYADPGLEGTIHTVAIDDAKKLVFVADSYRIKSFTWDSDGPRHQLLPVHTMDSGTCSSPISLLDGGARLLRMSGQKLLI
ncbi:hypothetical protein BOTBODRAFT_171002 [Botryobasidium botryosum FD-172 SS1]|uniref:Uncharacterized protein n=1 Tax=Botryobasidium botryosum (strain FD-172 SS1) TaxID=930990 RepID=A0A067MTF4_BOTB1|nr:hypothetical protein BOTBODRAFT_171002 [Botryobasidium botryosum FD-172 SS1]